MIVIKSMLWLYIIACFFLFIPVVCVSFTLCVYMSLLHMCVVYVECSLDQTITNCESVQQIENVTETDTSTDDVDELPLPPPPEVYEYQQDTSHCIDEEEALYSTPNFLIEQTNLLETSALSSFHTPPQNSDTCHTLLRRPSLPCTAVARGVVCTSTTSLYTSPGPGFVWPANVQRRPLSLAGSIIILISKYGIVSW